MIHISKNLKLIRQILELFFRQVLFADALYRLLITRYPFLGQVNTPVGTTPNLFYQHEVLPNRSLFFNNETGVVEGQNLEGRPLYSSPL